MIYSIRCGSFSNRNDFTDKDQPIGRQTTISIDDADDIRSLVRNFHSDTYRD